MVDQEQRNINVVESIGLLARTAVANSIVIHNNHAYLAEQTVMRIAGKMQLSSEEVRARQGTRLHSRICRVAGQQGRASTRAPQKESTSVWPLGSSPGVIVVARVHPTELDHNDLSQAG